MTRPQTQRSTHLGAFALLAVLSAGCHRNFDNQNDALRRQVLEQQKQIEALQAQVNECSAKLAESQIAAAASASGPAGEVVAALPRCAGIKLGDMSGWLDKDGKPGPEAVEALVIPFDGRHRFVQVAGTLKVDAFVVPPVGVKGEAALVASATLTPAQLREAYRSSFAGTYYSVVMPLATPNQQVSGTLLLRASLSDAVTGRSYQAEKTR